MTQIPSSTILFPPVHLALRDPFVRERSEGHYFRESVGLSLLDRFTLFVFLFPSFFIFPFRSNIGTGPIRLHFHDDFIHRNNGNKLSVTRA